MRKLGEKMTKLVFDNSYETLSRRFYENNYNLVDNGTIFTFTDLLFCE